MAHRCKNDRQNSSSAGLVIKNRTKDMINLLTFFSQVSPIKELFIIESVEDYNNNYEELKDIYAHRVDSLVSKPVITAIETNSSHQDFIKLIEQIKSIDLEGVLVMFDLSIGYSERYERYAGISIGVSVGNGVYIDAVGKGYDGREVSKNIMTHERYFIPWMSLNKCNLDNLKSFQTYLINEDDYKKSREERVNFLLTTGAKIEEINKHVPLNYEKVPDFIWEDVIKNILSKLLKMEDELLALGFSEFAISGHTEGKRFMPWGMFDKSRFILSK
jgi:hypothetical protein